MRVAYTPIMAPVHEIPADVLSNLSEMTRTAIERLRRHQPEEVDLFVTFLLIVVRMC